MIIDEKWPMARLIPITHASGVEAQERNAASVLLAVMAHVKEFGRSVLKPLGAPSGNIQTFVEVPFAYEGRKFRPDGLISISRGPKSWVALVETKVGGSRLELDQIHTYLDIAREHGYDMVISISNHYTTASQEYPIEVDKRRTRKTPLKHLSWFEVLTDAVVEQEHRGVSDPEQAYILSELIRYLKDERSGVVPFGGMGSAWTKVKDGARASTLRRADAEVEEIAARWDDLMRYVCLSFTSELGRRAQPVSVSGESAPSRRGRLKESLAASGVLDGRISIPDAVADISLVADLRARQLTVSTEVAAPRDAGSRGRVGWLVRQLRQAPPDTRVEARILRSREPLVATLGDLQESTDLLVPPKEKEVRGFHVSLTRPMGVKRDVGKGSFIDSVVGTAEEFYRLVVQDLRAWKPTPPKLKVKPSEPDKADHVAPQEIADEVQAARAEAVADDRD